MGGSARVDGVLPITGDMIGDGHPTTDLVSTRQNNALTTVDPAPETQPAAAKAMSHSVGEELEILRTRLMTAGKALGPCVEPAGRELVGETARMLERQVCRVAVVGQIKSGKSSFINAFSQQPSLLPTDVNPWTTAVTNLHFKQPRPDGQSATFRFFSEAEWEELVEGAGRLRELTKRLVPGFEPELLRQHVDALRRRAETRLGSKFQAMLGTSHTFRQIEPALLQRYVCSGTYQSDQDSSSAGQHGQFSDITKTADIYCDGSPFAFPLTLVDTPGTNDPFLLRDEVTRSSLEAADLYIVVLTARQPLAESDVALLRILRGLHKERILIFINRIDDLANIAEDAHEVTAYVRKKIAAEFPGADIPIVAGSAHWASCALQPQDPEFNRAISPRTLAYLKKTGALQREDMVGLAEDNAANTHSLRQGLFQGSGIPAAYEALSRMLGTSHCAHVLRQIAQCYEELARGSKIAARGELDQLNAAHANAVSTAHNGGQSLRKIETELHQLGDMTAVIEQSSRNIERQLKDILAQEMDDMRAAMNGEVAAQAREESDVLIDTLNRGRVPKVWNCEVGDLRTRLNALFNQSFKRAATRVLKLQSKVAPELHQLTTMLAPLGEAPPEPGGRNIEIPSPSLTSLGRFIALDLDTRWWSAWWSRTPGSSERGKELEQLILSEFHPVVEDLTRAAGGALDQYCSMTLRWSVAMCRNLIQSLERRGNLLRKDYKKLSQTVDENADPETVGRQARRISELRARAQTSESSGREFAQVQTALSKMQKRAPE